MNKFYLPFLFLLTVFTLFFYHSSSFQVKFDINYWQEAFSSSQVVLGGKATHFLSDSELYSIVGYKYVRGEDPTKIHPEVPPLGKYLIGASIIIFENENFMSFIFGIISLYLILVLSFYLTKSRVISLFSLFFTATNSQFNESISTANLDIFLLVFILASIFFFIKGLKKSSYFIFCSLFVGFAMATKFYATSMLLLLVFCTALIANADFSTFIRATLSLPLVLISLFISFSVSLLNNPSLIDFAKFMKWQTHWWAGNSHAPPGGVLLILYTGWWRTWWQGPPVIPVSLWDLTWPLITTFSLLSVFTFKKRKDLSLFVVWLWNSTYLIFIAITSAFPRYLTLFFPTSIILSVIFIYRLTSFISAKLKN